jgi:hypothetical protein
MVVAPEEPQHVLAIGTLPPLHLPPDFHARAVTILR